MIKKELFFAPLIGIIGILTLSQIILLNSSIKYTNQSAEEIFNYSKSLEGYKEMEKEFSITPEDIPPPIVLEEPVN